LAGLALLVVITSFMSIETPLTMGAAVAGVLGNAVRAQSSCCRKLTGTGAVTWRARSDPPWRSSPSFRESGAS
jgi:hypothetical protein